MVEAPTVSGHSVMHGLTYRAIEVARIEHLTPRYHRVTFAGEELADFITIDPSDHVRLHFRSSPDSDLLRPTRGKRAWEFPKGQPPPSIRDYTPRRFDPVSCQLEIDFVIHGEGPASNWADQANVGQVLGLVGPRASWILDETFDHYVLIGDETMLPSIARRLEQLPADSRAIAFIEVESSAEETLLAPPASAEIIWVHRGSADTGNREILEQTIRAANLPTDRVFVWAGGEAIALGGIRRYLRNELDIPVSHLRFSGHWKRGVANHDHHEPIED